MCGNDKYIHRINDFMDQASKQDNDGFTALMYLAKNIVKRDEDYDLHLNPMCCILDELLQKEANLKNNAG